MPTGNVDMMAWNRKYI